MKYVVCFCYKANDIEYYDTLARYYHGVNQTAMEPEHHYLEYAFPTIGLATLMMVALESQDVEDQSLYPMMRER